MSGALLSEATGNGVIGADQTVMAAPGRSTPATRLDGRRLYGLFLLFTPLLWLLGSLTLAGFLLVMRLTFSRWGIGRTVRFVAYAWMLLGATQAVSTIIFGVWSNDVGAGLRNAFGLGVLGWVLGGCAIAVGGSFRLNDYGSVRATARLGLYIIILGSIAAVAAASGRLALDVSPTPLSLLLPSSNAVTFYTRADFFLTESTLGENTTRLVLFFPWATALGLGGLAIFLISSQERDWKWRLIGMGGGMIGAVFSWSRIALACLLLVIVVQFAFRLKLIPRLLALCAIAATLMVLPAYGIDPLNAVNEVQSTADSARAGSSMARDLIYQKSWEGFLQSPIIGNGWIGESVHAKEILPIGSHSTIYGVLYTGGALTFTMFIATMALTGLALLVKLFAAPAGSRMRSQRVVGLCLFLCLIAFSRYESLFSLTLPCLFLFTWIGACLAPDDEAPPAKSLHFGVPSHARFS